MAKTLRQLFAMTTSSVMPYSCLLKTLFTSALLPCFCDILGHCSSLSMFPLLYKYPSLIIGCLFSFLFADHLFILLTTMTRLTAVLDKRTKLPFSFIFFSFFLNKSNNYRFPHSLYITACTHAFRELFLEVLQFT